MYILKRALDLRKRALYILKRALDLRKRARSLAAAIYYKISRPLGKRAMYILKRALDLCKRALNSAFCKRLEYLRKRALEAAIYDAMCV